MKTIYIGYIKRLALVFVCALIVRFTVVAVHCMSDAAQQHDAHSELVWVARNLVAGNGFSSPFGPGNSPTAWFAPALPYLWSSVMRVVGEGDAFLAIILGLNALVSALSVVIYAMILGNIMGDKKLCRLPFAACVGVLCLWPPSLLLTTSTWYYCWQELGIALLFLALQRWHTAGLDRCSTLWVAAAAAFVAYINPSALIVLIAAIGYQVCWGERRQNALRSGVVIVSILTLLMLPWTVRNYRALGKIVPMRSNFAVEFQQGNNPKGSIRQTQASVHPALSTSERQKYDAMGEGAYTTQAMKRTVRYVVENPWLTAKRTACRIYVFWCTDITDRWPWMPRDNWWPQGLVTKGWWVSKILLHTAPWFLALVVCASPHPSATEWQN